MDFFNKLGEKIAATSMDVSQKAKDLTETTRLNAAISKENAIIKDLYTTLGELFYSHNSDNEEDEIYGLIIKNINDSKENINKHKQNIENIKAAQAASAQARAEEQALKSSKKSNTRTCQNCGNKVPADALFCTSCGTKYVEPEPIPEPISEVGSESISMPKSISETNFESISIPEPISEPVPEPVPEPVSESVQIPVAEDNSESDYVPIPKSASDVTSEIVEEIVEEPKQNHCPNCNAVYEDGDMFCTSCGTKLS